MITRGFVKRFAVPVALVPVIAAGGLASSARADAPRAAGPSVCAVGDEGGLVTTFTSLRDGSSIDLARQPRFAVAGKVTGPASTVAKVSLFADGKYLGDPALTRTSGVVSWRKDTGAPAGAHVLTACSYTSDGEVSGAQVRISVTAPAAGATVVNPDVVSLAKSDLATVSSATPSSVTFGGTGTGGARTVDDRATSTKVRTLSEGDVLVGGVSAKTPQGLLRTVTGVSAKDGATVVATKPASLTDVLWQADIDQKDITLAVAGDESATTTWHYDKSFSGGGPFGASAKGNASLDLALTLRIRLKITSVFTWGKDPVVTVDDFLVSGTGTGTTKLTATTSHKGDVTFERKNLVNQVLAVIPLSASPPVVLTPTLALDLNVTGSTRTDLKWGAEGTVQVTVGTEYQNGVWTPIRSGSVTSHLTSPLAPGNPGASNLNTLTVTLTPRLDLKFGGVVGPSISLPLGATAAISYPCPGSATVDAFLKAQVGVNFGFLSANLGSASATVLDLTRPVYRGVAPGCPTTPSP